MYERIAPLEGSHVGIRITEDITKAENDAIVSLIEERFARHGPVRLLVVYEADPGLMGAESLYDNMRFAKVASDKLARMAVIGKHAWDNTWVGLFGLFGGIQTRYFSREETEEALAWLTGPD